MDLSSMIDLSGIQVEIPQMPSLSMSDMMESITITASSEDIGTMISGLLEGYQQYAADHPEADYFNIAQTCSRI